MPVAHQPLAAVIGELVGMAADQGGNLRLDGLRQQRSRAVAQHLGQRIGECSWLGELENISLCHGVSLLRWRSGSFEHPHDTPPYPFMPSPTFVDSSESSCVVAKNRYGNSCFGSSSAAMLKLPVLKLPLTPTGRIPMLPESNGRLLGCCPCLSAVRAASSESVICAPNPE